MNKSEQKKTRRKGARSPNYPVVSLKKSIEQVGRLYDTHKTHGVPVNMVHELWGYKAYGSIAGQCVAAAKAFGLINIEGKGKTRKICVSDRGHRIHKQAPEYENLLKKAALSPAIYNEIWEHYQGDLPNDELLKNYLIWEHRPRFNEQYVSRFIDLFKETISFANLLSGDIIEESEPENEIYEGTKNDEQKPKGNIAMSDKTGVFDLTIPLLDGLSAFLRIPKQLSETNYSQLCDFLKAIKPSITNKPKQDQNQDDMKENSNEDEEK